MILDPVVADYLADLYPASDPVLQEMERQGEADGVPIVMKDGGLTLGVLARAVGARRVVECGTAIGVSTLHLARAVGEGGEVITFDVDPDRQATARAPMMQARAMAARKTAPAETAPTPADSPEAKCEAAQVATCQAADPPNPN